MFIFVTDMGVVRGGQGAEPPYKTHYPPPLGKIETRLLRGITYVFLIKLFRYLLEQYLSNFLHTFHHYCLTLWGTQIYIRTFIKVIHLISNRKVNNISAMSKNNSLRVMEMYICFNIKIQAQWISKIIFRFIKFRIWLMTRISIKIFSLILRGALYLKQLLFW